MLEVQGSRRVISALAVSAVFLLIWAGAPQARAAGAHSITEILAREPIEPAGDPPELPLRLAPVELAASEGWSGALDDRWHSSDAFRGSFRDEFLEGLEHYLRARGFVVADDGAAVLRVTIDGFEGRKRYHDDGGDLRGSMALERGGRVLGGKALFESLSYEDESDERPAFARRYGLGSVHFSTVLFYRLAFSFYRSIEAGIVEILARDGAPGVTRDPAPLPSPQDDTGLVTIESVPGTAELLIDGALVATTPVRQLRLKAGFHNFIVRKSGHRDWAREVLVIAGNDVTLVAVLEESGPGGED